MSSNLLGELKIELVSKIFEENGNEEIYYRIILNDKILSEEPSLFNAIIKYIDDSNIL